VRREAVIAWRGRFDGETNVRREKRWEERCREIEERAVWRGVVRGVVR
jgi:hypothetical protein